MFERILCCLPKKHKSLSIKDTGYTTEQLLETIKEENKIINMKNNDDNNNTYMQNDINKKIKQDKYGSLEEISLL